jgi:hypothetical protein
VSDDDRLEINWLNSAGAALAAVSAAVLLSTLGAAGTLLGAALGSLCITVGGAFYTHSLKVTKQRVAAAQAFAARAKRSGRETSPVTTADRGTQTLMTTEELAGVAQPRSRAQVLRELPWKRVIAASTALFVVAMGIILAFELSTGRPVSAYTGGTSETDTGTTVPGLGRSGSSAGGGPEGEEEPSPEEQEGAPEDESGQDGDEQDGVPPPQEQGPAPVEEATVTPTPTATPETPTESSS